jgi:YNFM family putative membrane transporter
MGMALGLFTGVFVADRVSRKKVISIALISSSLLTILSSFTSIFSLLILINTVKGFLLAGATSVVMAYIAEEVHPSVLGLATSLSIAGNAVGGMGGRIAATLITGWLSWRWAALIIGISCLSFGLLFAWGVPESRHFHPVRVNITNKVKQMGRHLGSPLLISMYLLAGLMLGSFVSIYNYIGFRLDGSPFYLSHHVIASVYLMYIIGSVGSMSGGILSDRIGTKKVLVALLLLALAGLLLLLPENLFSLITGLGVFTFCFFGAHAIASRIVAQHIPMERSTAISLYLLFYYIGSSVLGTGTGIIMHHFGWVAFVGSLFIAVSAALALAASRRLK